MAKTDVKIKPVPAPAPTIKDPDKKAVTKEKVEKKAGQQIAGK